MARLVGRHNLEDRKDYKEGVWAIDHKKLSPLQKKRALRKLRELLPPIVNFEALFIADSARSVSLIAPALAVENLMTAVCTKEPARPSKTATRPRSSCSAGPPGTTRISTWSSARAATWSARYSWTVSSRAASARSPMPSYKPSGPPTGHEPGLMEAEAYDTAKMIQRVLQSSPPTRDAFRAAFAGIKDFPGVTGDTSIGPDREPQKELFYLSITAQGYQELDLGKLRSPRARAAWWPRLVQPESHPAPRRRDAHGARGSLFGRRLPLHLSLLALTLWTTAVSGSASSSAAFSWIPSPPGWQFAFALLSILLAHEMGHYVFSRIHRVDTSLPYFLPGPPGFTFGTFGAFIRMRSPIETRDALVDIGASGPIAGALVALPLLVVGLRRSHLVAAPLRRASGSATTRA